MAQRLLASGKRMSKKPFSAGFEMAGLATCLALAWMV